ncbi:hypothetical protein MRB53_038032 [Persea americana]|nr:hypothetical protein MRB53_038032 [Persea americana]
MLSRTPEFRSKMGDANDHVALRSTGLGRLEASIVVSERRQSVRQTDSQIKKRKRCIAHKVMDNRLDESNATTIWLRVRRDVMISQYVNCCWTSIDDRSP